MTLGPTPTSKQIRDEQILKLLTPYFYYSRIMLFLYLQDTVSFLTASVSVLPPASARLLNEIPYSGQSLHLVRYTRHILSYNRFHKSRSVVSSVLPSLRPHTIPVRSLYEVRHCYSQRLQPVHPPQIFHRPTDFHPTPVA